MGSPAGPLIVHYYWAIFRFPTHAIYCFLSMTRSKRFCYLSNKYSSTVCDNGNLWGNLWSGFHVIVTALQEGVSPHECWRYYIGHFYWQRCFPSASAPTPLKRPPSRVKALVTSYNVIGCDFRLDSESDIWWRRWWGFCRQIWEERKSKWWTLPSSEISNSTRNFS